MAVSDLFSHTELNIKNAHKFHVSLKSNRFREQLNVLLPFFNRSIADLLDTPVQLPNAQQSHEVCLLAIWYYWWCCHSGPEDVGFLI